LIRVKFRSIGSSWVFVEDDDAVVYDAIKSGVGWPADDDVCRLDCVPACEVWTVTVLHTGQHILQIVVKIRR